MNTIGRILINCFYPNGFTKWDHIAISFGLGMLLLGVAWTVWMKLGG